MSINGCDFFTCVPWWMHFSRELLKDNDMIPLEIWCTSALVNFLMTTKSHPPYGLKQFFRPWIIYFIDKLQSKSCCYTNKLLWWLTVRGFSTCSWLLWSQAVKQRTMHLFSQSFIFQSYNLLWSIVKEGGYRGLTECQKLFQNEIWNCSLHDKNVFQKLPIFFKRTLPHGKLSLNFVYTVSNAHAVLTYLTA